ncbi:MAG: class I SAM-dependent methyltransferase [Rikenellaceae bacterium]
MFGISEDEFLFLTQPPQRELVKANLGVNASMLALKGISSSICSQIKALEKCKDKLPHFYKAQCIIPPTSLEQASSVHTTSIKKYSGNRILDLTCGLGGDTSHFATTFKHIVTLERDALLSKIARYNFALLNLANIEVINQEAEAFLDSYKGDPFDMVYCDPARRDATRRTFLLEDCSPNIISLLDKIKAHTSTLIVKLSPLFDVEEVFRIFSDYGTTVEVISYDGECKEVIVEISFCNHEQKITNTVISKNGDFRKYGFSHESNTHIATPPTEKRYIYISDVTFKKCRNTQELMSVYFPKHKVLIDDNVVITELPLNSFPGRGYEIIDIFDYKPKALKKIFKERNIKGATIVKGNFHKPISEVRKALALGDNAQVTLLINADTLYQVQAIL